MTRCYTRDCGALLESARIAPEDWHTRGSGNICTTVWDPRLTLAPFVSARLPATLKPPEKPVSYVSLLFHCPRWRDDDGFLFVSAKSVWELSPPLSAHRGWYRAPPARVFSERGRSTGLGESRKSRKAILRASLIGKLFQSVRWLQRASYSTLP